MFNLRDLIVNLRKIAKAEGVSVDVTVDWLIDVGVAVISARHARRGKPTKTAFRLVVPEAP